MNTGYRRLALVVIVIVVVLFLQWTAGDNKHATSVGGENVEFNVYYRNESRGFEITATPEMAVSEYAVRELASPLYENGYQYITYIPANDDFLESFDFGIIEAIPREDYIKISCQGKDICLEPFEIGSNSKYVITYTPYPPSDSSQYCMGSEGPSHISLAEREQFTNNNPAFCKYYDAIRDLEINLDIFKVFEPR